VLTVAQDSVVKFKVHLEDDDAQASLRRSGLPAAGAWRACMVGGVALLLTPFREDGTFRITLGLKNTCEQRSSRLDKNVQTPNVRNIKLTQPREAPPGVVAPEHVICIHNNTQRPRPLEQSTSQLRLVVAIWVRSSSMMMVAGWMSITS
jgi:hypothetical protein